MNNTIKLLILIIISALLISGGTKSGDVMTSEIEFDSNKTISSQTSEIDYVDNQTTSSQINENDDHKQVFSKEIKIYRITRDILNSFLENPSYSMLKENNLFEATYPQDGEWHITSNVTRFLVKEELIDFLGDQTKIIEFLSSENITTNIEKIALLDAPNMPLTAWINTAHGNFYITINEGIDDKGYVYRFYSQVDFDNKYIPRDGKLIVFDKEVQTTNKPKVYHNYADVSLLDVLKALGAEIEIQSETTRAINFNDTKYILNLSKKSFFKQGEENNNLLTTLDGGSFFVYTIDNELMVDTSTMRNVLYEIGIEVFLSVNSQSSSVVISRR